MSKKENKVNEEKKEIKKEEHANYKELACRLYIDGRFESMANMALSPEEAIRMILELELYCCDNLQIHPLILQANIHNVLLNHLFAEPIDTEANNIQENPS